MEASSAVVGAIAAPGEHLCLDFVNTCCWRGRAQPSESLHGLADVLALAASGGVDPAIVAAFDKRWRGREQAGLFAAAIALREALYRLLAALAADEAANAADLRRLNAALAVAAPRVIMTQRDGGLAWSVALRPEIEALLSPILWSAADLLAGPRRGRVRLCANPECRWVFLDDSKSGNRRWCSMAACGNRAKAHRHYLKTRGAKPHTARR